MGDNAALEAGEGPADFLQLKQVGPGVNVRLSDPLNIAPAQSASNLLCVSNEFGLLFAATNEGFVVNRLQDVRNEFASGKRNATPTLAPWKTVATASSPSLGDRVTFLRVADRGQKLVVGLANAKVAIWQISDWQRDDSSAVLPAHTLEPPSADLELTEVAPNPSDRPELCVVLFAKKDQKDIRRAKVAVLDVQSGAWLREIALPDNLAATSLAWSVKGKQIVIGLEDGSLAQVTPEGDVKSRIAKARGLEDATYYVDHVLWLENHVFLITYNQPQTSDEPEHAYEVYALLRKGDEITSVHFNDPAPPFGDTSRNGHRYVSWLRTWEPMKHMLFMANTSSTDVGLLGCSADASGDAASSWQVLELEDTSRPALPFSSVDKSSDTSPVGLEIDTTASDAVDDPLAAARGEDGKGALHAVPILYVYTNDGILLAYHVINTHEKAGTYSHMQVLASNSSTGATEPATEANMDTKSSVDSGQSTSTSIASKPPASTFGQGSGFGAFAGSKSDAPAFGQSSTPTFGQSSAPSFGQSSTPSFGQSSAFGAFAGGNNTKSSFGQSSSFATSSQSSGFGAFASSNSDKPSTSGFGAFAASNNDKPSASGFGAFASANGDKSASGQSSGFGALAGANSDKPSFGQGSGFGSLAGTKSDTSPFGQSSGFGAFASSNTDKPSSSGFGAFAATKNDKPSFGQSSSFGAFSVPKSDKPSFSFGNPSTSTASPAAALTTAGEETSTDQKQSTGFSSFAGTSDKSPFGQSNPTTSVFGTKSDKPAFSFGNTGPASPFSSVDSKTDKKDSSASSEQASDSPIAAGTKSENVSFGQSGAGGSAFASKSDKPSFSFGTSSTSSSKPSTESSNEKETKPTQQETSKEPKSDKTSFSFGDISSSLLDSTADTKVGVQDSSAPSGESPSSTTPAESKNDKPAFSFGSTPNTLPKSTAEMSTKENKCPTTSEQSSSVDLATDAKQDPPSIDQSKAESSGDAKESEKSSSEQTTAQDPATSVSIGGTSSTPASALGQGSSAASAETKIGKETPVVNSTPAFGTSATPEPTADTTTKKKDESTPSEHDKVQKSSADSSNEPAVAGKTGGSTKTANVKPTFEQKNDSTFGKPADALKDLPKPASDADTKAKDASESSSKSADSSAFGAFAAKKSDKPAFSFGPALTSLPDVGAKESPGEKKPPASANQSSPFGSFAAPKSDKPTFSFGKATNPLPDTSVEGISSEKEPSSTPSEQKSGFGSFAGVKSNAPSSFGQSNTTGSGFGAFAASKGEKPSFSFGNAQASLPSTGAKATTENKFPSWGFSSANDASNTPAPNSSQTSAHGAFATPKSDKPTFSFGAKAPSSLPDATAKAAAPDKNASAPSPLTPTGVSSPKPAFSFQNSATSAQPDVKSDKLPFGQSTTPSNKVGPSQSVPSSTTPAPTTPSSEPLNGLQRTFLETYQVMEEEFAVLKKNVDRCASLQSRLRHPANPSIGINSLSDAAKWTFADLDTKDAVTQGLVKRVETMDTNSQTVKASLREVQSEQLKAESKREEIARFLRARKDPSFGKMVKIRQLGPEHAENQSRLRKGYASLQQTIEDLDAHLAKLREKLTNERLGQAGQMKTPSLDSIRRTVRNITRSAESKLMELQELELGLESMFNLRFDKDVPSSLAGFTLISLDNTDRSASSEPDDSGFLTLDALEQTLPTAGTAGVDSWAEKTFALHRKSSALREAFLSARKEPILNDRMKRISAQAEGVTRAFQSSDLNMAFAKGTIHVEDERQARAKREEEERQRLQSLQKERQDVLSSSSTESSPFTSFMKTASSPQSFATANATSSGTPLNFGHSLPPGAFDLPPETTPFAPGSSGSTFGVGPSSRSHHSSHKSGSKRNSAVALPQASSPFSSSMNNSFDKSTIKSDFFATPPSALTTSGAPPTNAFSFDNTPSKATAFSFGSTTPQQSPEQSVNLRKDGANPSAQDASSKMSGVGSIGFGSQSRNLFGSSSTAGAPSAFTTFKGLQTMKPSVSSPLAKAQEKSGSNQVQLGQDAEDDDYDDEEEEEEDAEQDEYDDENDPDYYDEEGNFSGASEDDEEGLSNIDEEEDE